MRAINRRAALGLTLQAAVFGMAACETFAQTRTRKPKAPPGRDPGGLAVAVLGSGVAYTSPEIAVRLARDGEGEMIGWDLIDSDPFPLELPQPNAADTPLAVPPSAGTDLVRIVLGEAGATRLIPVKVPGAKALALAAGLAFTARTPARVAAVLATGADGEDWTAFAGVVRAARNLLVIVPAGHRGIDMSNVPGGPHALQLPNLLVVTAATADGGLSPGVSWGATAVDVAVPVDDLGNTTDAILLENRAVARSTALAARLLATEPGLDGAGLKARLLTHAAAMTGTSVGRTRTGWIARASRIAWPE